MKRYLRIRSHCLIIWSITVLLAILIVPFSITHAAHAASSRVTITKATALSSRYTFTVFTNSSQSNMYIYQSSDGLNFTQLAASAYTPPSGLVRDPSIILYNGIYYVTYTTNWTGNTLGIATSTDRVHWTFLENVTLSSTVYETWAPEWFKDPSNGSINIIVNLNSTNAGDSNFIPQKLTALNSSLTSWSGLTPLAGLSPNYIDSFIIKVGNTYHAFVKNETTKYIEQATSTNLTGPYTFVGTGNWAGWGNNVEGPALYQLDNGTWRIVMDGYASGQYYYSDSSDGNLQTWTAKQQLPGGLSGFVRHGTVLKETFSTSAYYEIINRATGEALDVQGSSTTSGALLVQNPTVGNTSQQWQILDRGSYNFTFTNRNSGDLADITGGSTADGANVIQWPNNWGSNQHWQAISLGNGYYKLANANSGKVLEDKGFVSGSAAPVDQWGNNGGTNQQWSFVQV